MDVKAMNFFVDQQNNCFLGDFGSCKPIGKLITSCNIAFCWEDVWAQLAHPKYDLFMLLVMIFIECLEDRPVCSHKTSLYYVDANFINFSIKSLVQNRP